MVKSSFISVNRDVLGGPYRLHCRGEVIFMKNLIIKKMIKMLKLQMVINHYISLLQGVPDGVMDTYCWLHSTFTLPHLGVVEIDNVNGVDQVDLINMSFLQRS